MNEFDEIQRRNWGTSQGVPIAAYADLLKQAIQQAVAGSGTMQVMHVKLTINAGNGVTITADLSYAPVQHTIIEQAPALPEGIIIGEEDT